MGKRRLSGAQRARIAENKRRALELAHEGKTERKIAEILGVSKTRAGELKREALAEHPAAAVETLRAASTARLGKYLEALEPATKAGEPEAIRTAVRADESLRRLHGVDAPARSQIAVAVVQSEGKYDWSKLTVEELETMHGLLQKARRDQPATPAEPPKPRPMRMLSNGTWTAEDTGRS